MSIVALLSAGTIYIVISLYIDLVQNNDLPFYSYIAESILVISFAGLFVTSWKFYCAEWKQLSGKTIIQLFFEKVFFPLVTVFLVTPKMILDNIGQPDILILITGLLFIITLADIDSSIGKTVYNKFRKMNATNRRILYSAYPPRTRGDLLPLDAIIFIIIFVMIIRKLT
jgi:hypothetical protein